MDDHGDQNPYPDRSLVLTRYSLSPDDLAKDEDRNTWPWLPGVIESRAGENEWAVTITDDRLATLEDGSPVPEGAVDVTVYGPRCFRDCDELMIRTDDWTGADHHVTPQHLTDRARAAREVLAVELRDITTTLHELGSYMAIWAGRSGHENWSVEARTRAGNNLVNALTEVGHDLVGLCKALGVAIARAADDRDQLAPAGGPPAGSKNATEQEGAAPADKPRGFAHHPVCPLCSAVPLVVFGGGTQAFCPSPTCRCVTWNPTLVDGGIGQAHEIDLGGLASDRGVEFREGCTIMAPMPTTRPAPTVPNLTSPTLHQPHPGAEGVPGARFTDLDEHRMATDLHEGLDEGRGDQQRP